MTLTELRAKHPRFIYQQANWRHDGETLTVDFVFKLEPDIVFKPSIKISNLEKTAVEAMPPANLQEWVFQLGLVELFSYWKSAAPTEIVIEAGYLNSEQLVWWKKLLIKSMGEFFYTNNLDFTQPDFLNWTCAVPAPETKQLIKMELQSPKPDRAPYLLPVGGGKDSALALELLEENALEYDILLSFPQSPAAEKIAALSRAKQIIRLERTFDPQLFALNKAGYLNGHTPFSARLAFESSLVGRLLGHQQILIANEYSANEGNVPFHGTVVNHQYSKTFEFEESFRNYVRQYLSPTPEYLSFLRPITELQIAGLFAKYPRYHSLFKSCNRKQQQETWCCECAKCLFVFTTLYPFLEEKQLIGPIFPKNLFENGALNQLALALLGKDEHKPFECVGTYEETLAAFYLSIQHFRRQHPDQSLPAVLAFVEQEVLAKVENPEEIAAKALKFWHDEHNLDQNLLKIVKAAQERL